MGNPFNSRTALGDPAADIVPVTPSDSTDLTKTAIALYIIGAGDVEFDTPAGETRTVTVPANFLLPVGATRVRSTNTTATGIHALTVD